MRRTGRPRVAVVVSAVVVLVSVGLVVSAGVAVSDSSFTVRGGGFSLTCPANTVAEGATLTCTLANTSAEAEPWPVVAILHLSGDEDRALVAGSLIDVAFGARSPGAELDGGVEWIGETLVGYSRFDWSGTAGASPSATTTTAPAAHTRTVRIVANNDALKEGSEAFYVALGPDGSRGVGLLYNNRQKVTVTDDDAASSNNALSSLKLTAAQRDYTLSSADASRSVTVAYGVTEVTLTAEAAHSRAALALSASHGGKAIDLDGRGGTSAAVLSGEESLAVPLAVGTTAVTLTVTAEDGTAGTRLINVVRQALGDATTVSVSSEGFTLTCPATVARGGASTCTLANTTAGSAPWPVVAIMHSSADADRALVAEDPIIPDTDPNYSQDVSLGTQQPPRADFNYGYGELFSGGSRTVYRTYGYEKFDWPGNAAAGASRDVEIRISPTGGQGVPEVFYVALAPSGYTGLSQLADNKAPVLVSGPSVSSLAVSGVTRTAATVTATVANADGSTLHLRHRPAASQGSWTATSQAASGASVAFSLSSLVAGTSYTVEASFDSTFAAGVASATFTTAEPPPSVSGLTAGSIAQTAATVTATVANADGSTLHLRYRAGSGGEWATTSKTASGASVAFSLTSLTASTGYEVEASFDSTFASGVASASFTTAAPPPSVSGLTAGSITQTAATVTAAVANPDGSTLHLRHRPAASQGSWTATSQAASGASVAFSLTSLVAGTTYTVEASFDSGFAAGVASASFTTAAPPPSVSGLTAGSITQTAATVTASVANPDGSTLHLRYRAGSGGSWATTSKAASTGSVAFSLTSLVASTSYEVEASFDSTFASGVASASFTTAAPPPSVSGLTAGSITQTAATVTATVANADGSTLHLRHRPAASQGSWTATSQAASGASVAFSLSSLVAGTSYTVEASFDSTFAAGVASATFTTAEPGPPVVGFGSATYSGTEGQSITIVLRLSAAQAGPVRFEVHPRYGGVASWESDYVLGECPPDFGSGPYGPCPSFGRGYLIGEIPAGDTSFSHVIGTTDDDLVEGAETFTLEVHVSTRGVEVGDNSETVITIEDNDEAGVIVSESKVSIDEEGTGGTYTVKLASRPRKVVRIVAFSTNTWKVRVTPRVIDVSPDYWDVPHTFSVYGERDSDAADEEVVITHTVEPHPGSGYEGQQAASVTVSVDDQHTPSVMVTENALAPSVGATARYGVYLDADPSWIFTKQANGAYEPYTTCCDWDSHTVTITATSSNPQVATVSPASVTFNAHSDAPQSFTVTGLSAGTATITHTVTGTDPAYTGGAVVVRTVSVTVSEPPAPPQAGSTEQPQEPQPQEPQQQEPEPQGGTG